MENRDLVKGPKRGKKAGEGSQENKLSMGKENIKQGQKTVP